MNILTNKIGIYYYFGYETEYKERFNLIKQAGFDCTALWGGDNLISEEPNLKNKIPEYARNAGLEIEYIHAPFSNACSIWEAGIEGENYMDMIFSNIDYCHTHNINNLVMHLSNKYMPEEPSKLGVDRFKKIIKQAEKKDVNIALENLRRYPLLDVIYEAISSPKLGFCYDSGHQRCFSSNIEFLEKYPDKLMVLHLNDNTGAGDKHDIPFDGRCNWKKIKKDLDKSNYNGPIMLEVTAKKSRRYSKLSPEKFLERAYNSAVRISSLNNNVFK